jgi:hypothetical protein
MMPPRHDLGGTLNEPNVCFSGDFRIGRAVSSCFARGLGVKTGHRGAFGAGRKLGVGFIQIHFRATECNMALQRKKSAEAEIGRRTRSNEELYPIAADSEGAGCCTMHFDGETRRKQRGHESHESARRQ